QEDEWKWDEKKHQDEVWIGNVQGGIKCKLKDETYTPPLVNVYFNQSYLKSPKAWNNEGKGGIYLKQKQKEACLKIYTQDYILEAQEERNFEFEYLITPLKPIDYTKHWQTRYYHPNENNKVGDEWIEQAKQEACNYTIVHHGQKAHPFINYPFIEVEELKSLVDQAHTEDIKLKIYYTIREMSNHAAEFWPWYHLGLYPKASQNEPVFWENIKELWAQKVFGREVIPAWEHEFQEGKYKGDICSAVIVEPNSPLDNYYIEGLDWLVKEMGIDGIYIDDTSIGRDTLRRARKVLDQKEGALIDMHSWNHMNTHAGYANSALLYMDLFPYIDSLWYGEGFDYDESPEYWLTEITGMPYGLMGQMLQDGGNPYRGMLYGMTNRTGWGNKSAKPIYKLWDQFGIETAKMYGYWSKECPIKTDCEEVLATAYVKENETMIVLASWAKEEKLVSIIIDWEKIGLKKEAVNRVLPCIEYIQETGVVLDLDRVKVQPKKGIFIILSKNKELEC
ncbi:MAG: glycoside hydrolase domain-containing protein, partial [Cellulosilyticaceae bacterium]